MKTNRILLGLTTLTLLSCHRIPFMKSHPKDVVAITTAATTTDNNSVYQLRGSWTDQNAKQVTLSKLKGHPQIVAMIFTHCAYVCPRVVEEMKAIRDSLPANLKNEVGGVLVSFDPERDTPEQLKSYAAQRQLDSHWELLKGSSDQVRELSMVLNVRYQKLTGGNFSHTGNIYILDKNGNIVQSVDGLGGNIQSAVSTLNRLASR